VLDGHVGIGWKCCQKPVIGRREAPSQVGSGGRGGGGQPGFPEELLACRGPDGVGEKEVLQLAKPLAARDPDVAAFDFITQSRQHGTFVGTAIAGTIGANQGPEAFGHTAEWEVLWEGALARGVEVAEDLDGFQQGGRARRLQRDGEVGQQTGRKLTEVPIAFHHEGKHVGGITRQPLVRVLELTLQAFRGNLLKHRGADRVRRHRVVEQHLANRLEALEGVAE
jgi:hypothetical protein